MSKRYEYRLVAEKQSNGEYKLGIKVIDNKIKGNDVVFLMNDGDLEECLTYLKITNKGVLLLRQDSDFSVDISSEREDVLLVGRYTGTSSRVKLPEGICAVQRNTFRGNEHIKELELNNIVYLKSHICRDCTQLEKVNITLAQNCLITYGLDVVIPLKAFSGCVNLKEIQIPEGVVSIENGAFRDCSALEHVDLPTTVANIMNYSFNGCISLIKLVIYDAIEYISAGAFVDSGITDVYYIGNATTLTRDVYSAFRGGKNNTVLHIPDSIRNTDSMEMVDVRFKIHKRDELLKEAGV